jgi:hypothetical protein
MVGQFFCNLYSFVAQSVGREQGRIANAFMSLANIGGLSVRETTASLVCDDEMFDKVDFGSCRLVMDKLLTTNVFRKTGGDGRLAMACSFLS